MVGYFSISEFAHLCNTTRDTLIHYDKIGLLNPSFVASNGYRYYSFRQYESYQMIYTMKSLGIPLSKIKEYQKKGEPKELLSILDGIEENLDNQIDRMASLKQIVSREKHEMRNAIDNLNTFKIETIEEQPYIKIEGDVYNERTFASALLKLDNITREIGLNTSYSIGVYGSFEHMNNNNTEDESKVINFDGIYMLLLKKNKGYEIREKGRYLVTYIYTKFVKEEVDLFKRVMQYSKDNDILLSNEYYQESYGGPFDKLEDPLFLAKYLFKIKE